MRIILIFMLVNCAFGHSINYTKNEHSSIFKELHRVVPFISHDNPERFYGTYLIRNVAYKPVQKIRQHIERKRNIVLAHRGEAHITVITPPEYESMKKWKSTISMSEINNLVEPTIQHFKFEIQGIGSLSGTNTKNQETQVFFIVVQSDGLRFLRQLVALKYKIPKTVFDPSAQDFHITIGFTKSDLFPRPGFEARKEVSSLVQDLKIESIFN